MCVLQQVLKPHYINCSVFAAMFKFQNQGARSSTLVVAFLSGPAHLHSWVWLVGKAFHPWHFDWTPQFLQSEQGDKGSDPERKITQSER